VLGEITTEEADVGVALFSALKKSGVGDAAVVLHAWVHRAELPTPVNVAV
jgi:GTP-binding protein